MDRALIIGVGLIGGSFAMSLKDNGICREVWGVDNSPQNAEKALELGLVERMVSLDQGLSQADLIVLAMPVNAIPMEAIRILNRVSDTQIVMDMGSTKGELVEVISQHPKRERFVATHPMWGTEYSGPEAAERGAFAGRKVVICDAEHSAQDALQYVEQIYTKLGMSIVTMGAEEHDLHTAYVSHISHITSFALALTVLEKEREGQHIFDLAGGGFESTLLLAKSSAHTWVPILMHNKYIVLYLLLEHIHTFNIILLMLVRDEHYV